MDEQARPRCVAKELRILLCGWSSHVLSGDKDQEGIPKFLYNGYGLKADKNSNAIKHLGEKKTTQLGRIIRRRRGSSSSSSSGSY